MELTELSDEQQIALVALLEAVANSDGLVSEGEEKEINQIAEIFGDDLYRSLLNEAERRFQDLDDLKRFLVTIKDQEARELIYGVVLEEAVLEPSMEHRKAELLGWLAELWHIRVETEDEEAARA